MLTMMLLTASSIVAPLSQNLYEHSPSGAIEF
jgi:hypothetical protein